MPPFPTAVLAVVDPTQVVGLGGLGALFAYTRWLIVRSDRALDERARGLVAQLNAMEKDRDYWRSRALGGPPPE